MKRGRHAPSGKTGRRYARARWAAAPLLSPLLFAFMVSSGGAPGNAGADQNPTTGSAYAQLLQIAPHEGSLAVGAIFGEALAGHANGFARAQSQGVDLGAVGASLKGFNCGAPPALAQLVPDALQAETGGPGAATGQTQGPSQADYGANEYVLANATPYGQADTTFAGPVADPTNAFVMSGLHSKSWSGIVNGVTEAGATSDIGSISLGNGAVVLGGLHWEALWPTGGSGKPTGSFSIGNVKVGGVTLPTGLSLDAIAAAVNTVLGTVGIQLNLPQTSITQGVESVTPLELQVVANTTRDSVIDPVLTAIQPDYYQITTSLENGFATAKPPLNALAPIETTSAGQQLATALCQSDTPITVLDVSLAAFDGGGYFTTSLGGVTASSSELTTNPFSLGTSGLGTATIPGTSTFIPGTLGSTTGPLTGASSLGAGPSLTTGTATTTPTSGTGGQSTSLGPSLKTVSTVTPSGPLLAAGLAGLGLLALLALADRRKMRLAQKAVPMDE